LEEQTQTTSKEQTQVTQLAAVQQSLDTLQHELSHKTKQYAVIEAELQDVRMKLMESQAENDIREWCFGGGGFLNREIFMSYPTVRQGAKAEAEEKESRNKKKKEDELSQLQAQMDQQLSTVISQLRTVWSQLGWPTVEDDDVESETLTPLNRLQSFVNLLSQQATQREEDSHDVEELRSALQSTQQKLTKASEALQAVREWGGDGEGIGSRISNRSHVPPT